MKISKIYFIGCGGVAFATLEIFKKENLYYDCEFVIIEPKPHIPDLEWVMKGRKYKHVQEAITPANHKKLLKDISADTFVINLSVNVDSIMLVKYTKEKKALYIDTSLEQYWDFVKVPVDEITKYDQFKKNNLFEQQLVIEREMGKSKATTCLSCGFNPGYVSEFAKRALVEYAKTKGKKLEKNNYAKLGHELGLRRIQVVEYDTQQLRTHSTAQKFVNTWSAVGLQEEGTDLIMLSLCNQDMADLERDGVKLIKPTGDPSTHIRFIPQRGMDGFCKGKTLDYDGKPFDYTGMFIPHQEIITLSDFFSYKGDAPSVMYIYRPCNEALAGLEFVRKNNYEMLKDERVVRADEIISGYDSIGSLLTFENGDQYGGWTVCSIDDAKKMHFKSGPTMVQVASFVSSVVAWSILHSKAGLIYPEDIDYDYIFNRSEKYLGKVYFKSL